MELHPFGDSLILSQFWDRSQWYLNIGAIYRQHHDQSIESLIIFLTKYVNFGIGNFDFENMWIKWNIFWDCTALGWMENSSEIVPNWKSARRLIWNFQPETVGHRSRYQRLSSDELVCLYFFFGCNMTIVQLNSFYILFSNISPHLLRI